MRERRFLAEKEWEGGMVNLALGYSLRLTSDGWLLYIFSLYSATCFSGYFSNYGFYHVSDNVHYVAPVHLSWTTLEQKSGSKCNRLFTVPGINQVKYVLL